MLEPRDADIPALFLFLVVLPLVTYFLLGKWNEATKRNARISMLAQLAAEEALRVEAMATADVISTGPSLSSGLHQCARCFSPATTRCSRCKSIRYCSGKCQIIHWRQGHKQECQQWENSGSIKYVSQDSTLESVHNSALAEDSLSASFIRNAIKEPMYHNVSSDTPVDPAIGDAIPNSAMERNVLDRKFSHRQKREILRNGEATGCSYEEIDDSDPSNDIPNSGTSYNELSGKGAPKRPKPDNDNCSASDEIHRHQNANSPVHLCVPTPSRSAMSEPNKLMGHITSVFESTNSGDNSPSVVSNNITTKSCKSEMEFDMDKISAQGELYSTNGTLGPDSSVDRTVAAGGIKFKKPPYTIEPSKHLSQKPAVKGPRESPCSGVDRTACMEKKSSIHAHSNNGVSATGDNKMAGAKKLPKLPKRSISGILSDSFKKNKMLFPYEELVKFFQCEVCDVFPRGLLNCGNSCYANAVLQCLTCTKPLTVYLLRGMHSRTCSVRDWCLMCELEMHVSMLRESGGPLSPSRILSNMRNIGCRIGSGTQEDAHEFLRLLVTSMQSICLEGLGGEKEVDTRLQETTLIQQIFGGRLRSKVKCLRCHLESERYENIMDLTLEIHGWVESLEDALTQFTAPEDLDGENMYRCGRCLAYVKARKQLSVHEVPNILTIVLKRFQTGNYGKINKYVTFPDLLDMIPFMTGTGDSPPLYMLYAVVVHLDTCNASFSGHYVSYVKDLQGTWFKIDDIQVQVVPFSQVMSEGAYMLFYSRSFPRPPRSYSGKVTSTHPAAPVKHVASKTQTSPRHGQSRPSDPSFVSGASLDVQSEPGAEARSRIDDPTGGYTLKHASGNSLPPRDSFADSISIDFSDATSSEWSLFTSSDESSFTTESASDSFSIADYGDTANLDPISSIFSPFYIPEGPRHSTISRAKLSSTRPQTRFYSESRGFVLDSAAPTLPQSLGSVHKGRGPGRVDTFVTEPVAPLSNCTMSVRPGSNPRGCLVQTTGCWDA
uniref:ubiquitinyl hydrolase 1 n=1 Tax=Anthurium amnicola TaxID=1678845 RepID=A0A1D1YT64_9ARAE